MARILYALSARELIYKHVSQLRRINAVLKRAYKCGFFGRASRSLLIVIVSLYSIVFYLILSFILPHNCYRLVSACRCKPLLSDIIIIITVEMLLHSSASGLFSHSTHTLLHHLLPSVNA